MSIKEHGGSNPSAWDSVAGYFSQGASRSLGYYMPGKENFETVWPFLLQVMKDRFGMPRNSPAKVCDFGCGTGILAEEMHQAGFRVFACDISKEMIVQARSLARGGVFYEVGSLGFMKKYSPYEMVTSIMVFQFIPDLEPVIGTIAECLNENGVLLFAVHAAEYADECMRHGIKFCKKDIQGLSTEWEILIGDKWIRTYIRDVEWYDNVLCSKGFIRMGYTFEGTKAPSCITDDTVAWQSAKYYIAWYIKKN